MNRKFRRKHKIVERRKDMVLKNGQIYDIAMALGQMVKMRFPVATAYRIAKVAQVLEPSAKLINDARVKILEEYGEKKGPTEFTIPKEKIEEFNLKIQSLMDIDEEINLPLIPLESLAGAELTPQDMAILMPIIEE